MRGRRLAITAAVVFVTAAGIAYAAIPDGSGTYTACKLRATGTIRLIDKTGAVPASSLLSHCTSYEDEITWNQAGQRGPVGPQGDKGDAGSTGLPGTAGGSGHAYYASNTLAVTANYDHDANTYNYHELVGLNGIPAGTYVVWGTVSFEMENSVAALYCKILKNGVGLSRFKVPIDGAAFIHDNTATVMEVVTLSGPPNLLTIECGKIGDTPIATAKIVALHVDAVN